MALAVLQVTPEGVALDPQAVEDRRTEAEKKFEAHMQKYEEARAKKTAAKSHRDRIKVGRQAGWDAGRQGLLGRMCIYAGCQEQEQ